MVKRGEIIVIPELMTASTYLVFPPLLLAYYEIEEEFNKQTGQSLSILETYRSFIRQDKLYRQGRSSVGAIVTSTEPGQSMHNFALAMDVVGDMDPNKPGRQDPYGIRWDVFGQIAKDKGLTWGGDFGIKDKGHIEMTAGMGLKQILQLWQQGGVMNVWRQVEVNI